MCYFIGRDFTSEVTNQAELLAEGVSAALVLPLDTTLVKRVRQAGTHATERQANVHSAFEAAHGLFGLHVLWVDDVITTNATLGATAGALKQVGAVAVHGLTFARDL
jgi:predicted amidophosphoribosyltransferase